MKSPAQIVDALLSDETDVASAYARTAGRPPFQPINHPLKDNSGGTFPSCRKCGSVHVDFPAYPGDFYDCRACGHSWEPTANQKAKMIRGNDARRQEMDRYDQQMHPGSWNR